MSLKKKKKKKKKKKRNVELNSIKEGKWFFWG